MPSAGLIPHDPTLLFTVAGMVPFKEYFVGLQEPPFKRAVSVQKCLRAGGKHNDLEEIGRTNRHLSFFEMLGNFSFGDYFKVEAIEWAWEFSTQVLGFNPDQIWITVHESDEEAARIWQERAGVAPERIQRLGEPNYWRMGDTGPCGPCSELFIDKGEEFGPGGGPAEGGEERYIEFWNLVFMQYEQTAEGDLTELPSPSIDTGAGLERILALLNGVDSVFEAGDLAELVQKTSQIAGVQYGQDEKLDISLRIVAEHIRAATFMVSDGAVPSNEERGYVLRRILRRAIRHAHLLGAYKQKGDALITTVLAEAAIKLAEKDYPQLTESQDLILQTLEREESRFLDTLISGAEVLGEALKKVEPGGKLSGEIIFLLHDTYGFPSELTEEIALESGFTMDTEGFEQEMKEQKSRARKDFESRTGDPQTSDLKEALSGMPETEFLGNSEYELKAKVIKVLDGGLVLDRTSFYAESGGQVGDIGTISSNGTEVAVIDTTYGAPGVAFHHTAEPSPLKEGQEVIARINGERRDSIRRHHTATHILHWALRKILGDHVSPQGSLVEASRLRFDFSHWEGLSPEKISEIEDACNAEILSNEPVLHYETTKSEADDMGALSFFGDKYGEIVKVLEAGRHSIELCGGTHVGALGDIGLLKIISESSIGSNIRRVEAVCGSQPVDLLREREAQIKEAADLLGVAAKELVSGLKKRVEEIKELRQELGSLKSQSAMGQLAEVQAQAQDGIVAAQIPGVERDTLRKMALKLAEANTIKVAVLGTEPPEGGAALVAAVSESHPGLNAGEVLSEAVKLISGGGGKGEHLAIAGGKDASGLDAALEKAKEAALKQVSK